MGAVRAFLRYFPGIQCECVRKSLFKHYYELKSLNYKIQNIHLLSWDILWCDLCLHIKGKIIHLWDKIPFTQNGRWRLAKWPTQHHNIKTSKFCTTGNHNSVNTWTLSHSILMPLLKTLSISWSAVTHQVGAFKDFTLSK